MATTTVQASLSVSSVPPYTRAPSLTPPSKIVESVDPEAVYITLCGVNKDKMVLVDKEDAKRILAASNRWYWKDQTGVHARTKDNQLILLHRIVMKAVEGVHVGFRSTPPFVNRKLDCRKKNLFLIHTPKEKKQPQVKKPIPINPTDMKLNVEMKKEQSMDSSSKIGNIPDRTGFWLQVNKFNKYQPKTKLFAVYNGLGKNNYMATDMSDKSVSSVAELPRVDMKYIYLGCEV